MNRNIFAGSSVAPDLVGLSFLAPRGELAVARFPPHRLLAGSAAVVAVLLFCSCNSQGKLHPVHGQVIVAGKPAEGALVVFHRIGETSPDYPKPSGQVDADGSFTLGTYAAGDGAPVGEYIVAIAWLGDVAQANPVTGEIPTKLSARYAEVKSSPLRAQVKEGPNEIPAFQLPK